MNVVFRLTKRPGMADAQRLSEALDRERGVISALVDPQRAQIFVTFDPALIGDLRLQRLIEAHGYPVTSEDEPLPFSPENPGYLAEIDDARLGLDVAAGAVEDAELGLQSET